MKRLYFNLFTFFFFLNSFGQDSCQIGFVSNSNKILYNQASIENIIEPSKYKAFFLGESHTINFEPEFKFNFIKHLHSKYSVKDIFMEIGNSAAYFFNLYLQKGDTTILLSNQLPYLWGHYKDFWKNLYDYNKSLPDTLKISIHGLDFERKEIFNLLLKAKQPGSDIPAHLQQTFVEIENLRNDQKLFFGDKEFRKAISKLSTTYEQYESDFKTLYGDNYKIVQKAFANKATSNLSINQRNQYWFDNMKEIFTESKIGRFIGFFGSAHTRYNNSSSLTVSLKQSDFFQGEILNISTIYKNFITSDNAFNNRVLEYGYKEKDIFEKFYNKNCRAIIVKSINIPKTNFKTESDYIIFAEEISDN